VGRLRPSSAFLDEDGVVTQDPAEALVARRALLEEQLAQLRQPPEPGSIGFGKRVGEGTSQAVERIAAVSAEEKLQAMLTEVKRAQEKLVEGTYGRCDVCGVEIPPERLAARPWATRCVSHA
jgi:DnaK suppressor protein